MLSGRQIPWMIYNDFKITVEDQAPLDFEDLVNVKLHADNLFAFMNDWETCLSGFKQIPETNIMESLFRKQLGGCQQL